MPNSNPTNKEEEERNPGENTGGVATEDHISRRDKSCPPPGPSSSKKDWMAKKRGSSIRDGRNTQKNRDRSRSTSRLRPRNGSVSSSRETLSSRHGSPVTGRDPTEFDGDAEEEMVLCNTEDEEEEGKEKRGLPPSTGKFAHLEREKRKILKEVDNTKRALKAVKDPGVPAQLSDGRKKKELEATREIRMVPTESIVAIILEKVGVVDKVNEKSSNLNGKLKGELNGAAAYIFAAVNELVKRRREPASGDDRDIEMERLRNVITSQKEEIASLKVLRDMNARLQVEMQEQQAQMLRMQQQMTQLQAQINPLPRPVREGRNKRKKVLDSTTTSSSVETEEHTEDYFTEDVDMPELAEEESTYEQTIREIQEKGMPVAIRPALKGVTKIIDEATPPESAATISIKPVGKGNEPANKSAGGVEERLFLSLSQKLEQLVEGAMKRITLPLTNQTPATRENKADPKKEKGKTKRGASASRTSKKKKEAKVDGGGHTLPPP